MFRLKIIYWIWTQLGLYLRAHIKQENAKTISEEVVAVQTPQWLFMDGTWMPDRHQATRQ